MKTNLMLFFSVLFFGLWANQSLAHAQQMDEPYVILVEYTFAENNVDEAIELLSDLQAHTLEKEVGCMVYDLLWNEDDHTKIIIYESYVNEAAFNVHINSAYFREIVPKKLKPLIKEEKITKVIPLNQDDEMVDEEV